VRAVGSASLSLSSLFTVTQQSGHHAKHHNPRGEPANWLLLDTVVSLGMGQAYTVCGIPQSWFSSLCLVGPETNKGEARINNTKRIEFNIVLRIILSTNLLLCTLYAVLTTYSILAQLIRSITDHRPSLHFSQQSNESASSWHKQRDHNKHNQGYRNGGLDSNQPANGLVVYHSLEDQTQSCFAAG
jgi:hypothetical protein